MKIKEACDCKFAQPNGDVAGYVPCRECPNQTASLMTIGELRDLIRAAVAGALATRFPTLPPV